MADTPYGNFVGGSSVWVTNTGTYDITAAGTYTTVPNTALWGQCISVLNAPAVESKSNKKLLLLEEGL